MEFSYLTDEEQAVVNAMRMGAEVQAHFFDSTAEAALEHAETLSGLADTEVRTLTTSLGTKFDSYDLHIGKHTIYHFVDK